MAQFPYDSLDPGGLLDPNTPLGSVVQQVRTVWCNLSQEFLNWTGDPLGFGQAIRSITCPPAPPPVQTPVPGVPGGRCPCVLYTVNFTNTLPNGSQFTGNINVTGEITSFGWFNAGGDVYDWRINHQNTACTGSDFTNLVANVGRTAVENPVTSRINSITRVDGQPDLCGGFPPQLPPVIPTPGDLNFNVPVTIAPGIVWVTPVIVIRPDIDFNINPDFILSPKIYFRLPDFNIDISFGPEAIYIFPPSGPQPPQPRLPDPRGDDPILPPPRIPPVVVDCDLTEVIDRLDAIAEQLDDIEECACPDERPLVIQTFPVASSRRISLPPETQFCRLQITVFPPERRTQAGGAAADVLYAGWGWFSTQGGALERRTPVDAEDKFFTPPPYADGFEYTLYTGFEGVLSVYRLQPQ